MLELGKNYSANFPSFLATVSSGRPVAECFRSVYGKSFGQVMNDLHSYVKQASVSAALFDVKLGKSDLEPEVSKPSELEVDLALANLLASQARSLAEASERLGTIGRGASGERGGAGIARLSSVDTRPPVGCRE